MATNNPFSNEENTPLCRFGPGGDFVSDLLPRVQIGADSIGKTFSKTKKGSLL